jgi:hypothetical protein
MQSYANHTKWDVKWHFIVLPILLFNVFGIDFASIWDIVVAIALLLAGYGTRVYALQVQDRLIRLEERLRLEKLLPKNMQSRIGELSVPQLIALRFASDTELPALAEEVLKTQMGPKQIKQAIKNWRPDEFRV